MSSYLEAIPRDVLFHIFRYAAPTAVDAIRLTSKRCKDDVENYFQSLFATLNQNTQVFSSLGNRVDLTFAANFKSTRPLSFFYLFKRVTHTFICHGAELPGQRIPSTVDEFKALQTQAQINDNWALITICQEAVGNPGPFMRPDDLKVSDLPSSTYKEGLNLDPVTIEKVNSTAARIRNSPHFADDCCFITHLRFFTVWRLKAIPREIEKFRSLTLLDFQLNRISSLPPQISALQSLICLKLGSNQLTSLEPICSLTGLELLHVKKNKIETLPNRLYSLLKLREIDLGSNLLTSLSSKIALLTGIKLLKLKKNRISSLPQEIYSLPSLRGLDISNNPLPSLSSSIGSLAQAMFLNLSGIGIDTLPIEIGKLTKLDYLKLEKNRLSSFPDEFFSLQGLRELIVNNNIFTSIPTNISNLTSLIRLEFNNNQISSLSDQFFSSLTQVEVLSLKNNLISSLPASINYLEKLRVLEIGGNQLSSLPKKIDRLSALQELYAENNQFEVLPEEMEYLLSLHTIDFRNNKFDSISKRFQEFQRLDNLILDGNQISTLPEWLATPPKRLTNLSLNNNPLFEISDEVLNSSHRVIKYNPAVVDYKEDLTLPCSSLLATLYQALLLHKKDREIKDLFHSLSSSDQKLISEKTQTLPSHTFSFYMGVREAILAKFALLSLELRERVYKNVHAIANQQPTSETWGKEHALDQLCRLADAMEWALEPIETMASTFV